MIIGLIVGGILVGQELIRSANLKSVITDEQKYVTAVNAFRTKYNELPGDMVDATNYWGTDPTGCPGGYSTVPLQATCNGNGNGLIESDGTGENNTPDQKYENFRAWQQLANVGLIQGAYTGTNGSLSWTDNEPGLNVPATKIPNGGFEWMAFNAISRFPASNWNAQYNTQYLLVGGANSGSDLVNALGVDAQAIDIKIDDGLPLSGTVLSTNGQNSANIPCVNNVCTGACVVVNFNGGIVTTYASTTNPGCSILFQVKSW